MKTSFFVVILISLLVISIASPGKSLAQEPADRAKGHGKVVIPAHAVEIAPGIFSLGTAIDKGRVVEGYAIITTGKKKYAKPACNNNGICESGEKNSCADCRSGDSGEPDTSGCYEYISGAKWNNVEPYEVNPGNTAGLDDFFVFDNLSVDIDKWEFVAEQEILGDGTMTPDYLEADFVAPDDHNEVYFANVDSPGAIAVTVIWGIFRGPPRSRALVEWDQVYDDTDFYWSEDCLSEDCTYKMDFESIATHELGHSVGLSDLYTLECTEQTMYGYAGYGETKKRDLQVGDIAGVSALY
jgi:hypothetical protein